MQKRNSDTQGSHDSYYLLSQPLNIYISLVILFSLCTQNLSLLDTVELSIVLSRSGIVSCFPEQFGIPWFSYLSNKYPWLATFWSPTWEPADWVHGVSLIAQSGTNIIKSCKVELSTVWEVNKEEELSLTKELTSLAESSWRTAHDCTQWNEFHYKPRHQHF